MFRKNQLLYKSKLLFAYVICNGFLINAGEACISDPGYKQVISTLFKKLAVVQ
jgi:hypothetical protein